MPFQPPETLNPPPTPAQFWDVPEVRQPEQRLWLAVAALALEDGDLRWFESLEFDLLAESLGVDPEAVRQQLFKRAA